MPPARDFLLEDVDELPPPIPERKCSLDGLLDVDEGEFTLLLIGGRFGPEMGRIGTKWDKLGTF